MIIFNAMLNFISLAAIAPLLYSVNGQSHVPVISLSGYGSFSGTNVLKTNSGFPLPAAVNAWLGIDYATQPVGDRRFLPIKDFPRPFDGTRNATQYGPMCMQYQNNPAGQSEACLNFNVWRTAGVSMDRKLPTLVWIHGGSFQFGSGRGFDGASFVASSKMPIAVVTFNYRLGAFGFLPSELFKREGLLNLGLQDQHFLLDFLQKHLPSFGGDAKQITLGGLSAGSHSTSFQYFHNYGNTKDKPTFARAIMQSGSATARGFPPPEAPKYKQDFDDLMAALHCSTNSSDSNMMDCLRKAPAAKLAETSTGLYDKSESQLSWSFQPALGGPFLEKRGSQSGADGTFFHVPVITTHCSDEGKLYAPGNLETNDDFVEYWHRNNPNLNYTDLALLNELYPDPITHPEQLWQNSLNSTQWNRIGAAVSDMAYICPSRWTALHTSSAGVPTWRLHFNARSYPLEAESWEGIPHASDMAYMWNDPAVPFNTTAHIYYSYMASFVATGDPNKLRLEGAVEWPRYQASSTPGAAARPTQIIVNPGNFTVVEVDQARLRQCEFWNDPSRAVRLNK